MRFQLVPMVLRDAAEYVREHHRHSKPPRGGYFATSLVLGDEVLGVVIAGRPVAPGWPARTMEITRCCTTGSKNAPSKLYGAVCRAAQSLGFARVITYTRADEPGTSLRASGFTCFAFIAKREWTRGKRPRPRDPNAYDRFRWERALERPTPAGSEATDGG